MMRHAILIQAHKNFYQLCKLISFFNIQCDLFIHIDKKSSFTKEELKELALMPNVKRVYRKYNMHWGGFSILKCELFLIKEALKLSDAEYFHLLSGQDYPIKPLNNILLFFEKNKGKEFLECTHLPTPHWENNTYERLEYFYFYDWNTGVRRVNAFMNKVVNWQKRHKIKRHIPNHFNHLYGGSAWFSITREGAIKLLTYTKEHVAFYHRLKYTFAPDEIYVNTVLTNLTCAEKICNKNYRYIRWELENNSYPANLGKEHFYKLAESDSLFARKIETPYSELLIKQVDQYLLYDPPISFSETGVWKYDSFHKYKYDRTLAKAIFKLCEWLKIKTAVDIGCGGGFYVSELRRMGLAIAGYDGNPHTPELSSLLLSEDDIPCDVADLTDHLICDDLFDLVLCLDVCPYIPRIYENKVINNLTNIAKRFIILSWATPEQEKVGYINKRPSREIETIFNRHGFVKNNIITCYLKDQVNLENSKESIIVFEPLRFV